MSDMSRREFITRRYRGHLPPVRMKITGENHLHPRRGVGQFARLAARLVAVLGVRATSAHVPPMEKPPTRQRVPAGGVATPLHREEGIEPSGIG
jgi:hypothetical protein